MTEMTNLLIFTIMIWTAGLTEGASMRVTCNNKTKSKSSLPSTVISTSSSSTISTSSSPSSTISTSSSPSSTISTSSSSTTTSPMTSQTASDESNIPEEPPFTSPASTPTTDSSSKTTHLPQTNDNISVIQDNTSVIAGFVVGGVTLIVIVIIIFICRKRSQNRSSTTKQDTEKIDVNPDYISMDYQRIHRGQPDGGEIDDDLTKADNDADLNEVIESDNSGQTASKSNKDVVYADVNKPGRKSLGSESNSVASNFPLGDDGSHYVDVDGVKDSIGQVMSEDNPDETSYAVVNKPGKSLGDESNYVAANGTLEEDGPHYADIDDLVKDDSRQPQGIHFILSEDTPGTDSSVVNKFKGFSQNNDGRTGSINQDTDHYTSIDINDSPKLQNTKNSISNDDDKVSSEKTQESDGTRSQEDSSDGPVYSVVNKAKNIRNSLEADDKSPERIITENELYVPFDDEASDRIVMENDLYVPMEDTLLPTGL